MAIQKFQDGWTLKKIREDHLNMLIDQSNANLAKVTGLQDIVYRSFVKASVDAATSSIVFEKHDGSTEQTLSLAPILDQYQHGVDFSKQGGTVYRQQHSAVFIGEVEVAPLGADVGITIPGVTGEVGSTTRKIRKIQLSGETASSSLSPDGTLNINLAGSGGVGSISGQIGGGTKTNINTVNVAGNVGGSSIRNGTLSIELPDPEPLGARLKTTDMYSTVEYITLLGNRGTSSISGKELRIDLPFQSGQIGAGGTPTNFHKVKVIGYSDSEIASDTLTLDIPGHLTIREAGKPDIPDVTYFSFDNCTVEEFVSGKVNITPKPLQGQIKTTPAQDVKTLRVDGNITGTSIDANGLMSLNVPFLKGGVTTVSPAQDVTEIRFKGKSGAATIDHGVLTVDIPTGGGTGGSIKGEIDGSPAEDISLVKIVHPSTGSSVSGGTLTIDMAGGGGGGSITAEVDGGAGGPQNISNIKVTGDVAGTSVGSNELTINIPHATGVNVKESGGPTYTAMQTLEFVNATVTDLTGGAAQINLVPFKIKWNESVVDAAPIRQLDIKGYTKGNMVGSGIATINIPNLQTSTGTGGGKYEHVDTIELTGSLGLSSFHDGVLTIDLPAGGGGGGTGGSITGVVGPNAATIERVVVTGDIKNSSVDSGAKTLTVNVNPKATISDTAQDLEDIDIVQVAHSTVELQTVSGGKRKAVITPQVVMFFNGWYKSMTELNNDIDVSKRIPTKTCAYVLEPTGLQTLYVWMPDMTNPGRFLWAPVPLAGSVPLYEGATQTSFFTSLKKNDMIEIDDNTKQLTIKDVSVPETMFDTMGENGSSIILTGKFNKLRFMDGEETTHYDSNTKTLSLFKAQRRLDMGGDPDTTATAFIGAEFEGSLFMNKTDKCWWGYSGKDVGTSGYKRWTRVLHPRMSDHVSSLNERVSEVLPQITTLTANNDNALWNKSGWTGVPKDAPTGILPDYAQGQQGMVIQTFVGPSGSGAAPTEGRLQIAYMGADATMYKRFRDETSSDWSKWAKMSFNEGDLARHNQDKSAHRLTHPFYQVCGFGCRYPDLAGASKGLFKYILENEREYGLLASSGSPFAKDSVGIKVPYDDRYSIRGLAYIGGASDLGTSSTPGTWSIQLQKCESNSSIFYPEATYLYLHDTTTLKYPPISFNFERIQLKEGDYLRLEIKFTPKTGSETDFFNKFPELWIMPGRSFFSVDVDGNDTGYCIGRTMSRMYGGFSPLGGGAFGYKTGNWPKDQGHIVADPWEDPVEAKP